MPAGGTGAGTVATTNGAGVPAGEKSNATFSLRQPVVRSREASSRRPGKVYMPKSKPTFGGMEIGGGAARKNAASGPKRQKRGAGQYACEKSGKAPNQSGRPQR
ncbi:hypothetical protein GCM10022406_03370 [Hymenobacter algoricola]|uniref:Uncharacterized protein n=1 Tax=Hymenobacter algoricola TaxID=486267 RepID=A0ABP7MCP6_9BACT